MEPLVGQDHDRHYNVITCGTSACGQQACNVSFLVTSCDWVTLARPPVLYCVSLQHEILYCSFLLFISSSLILVEVCLPCLPLMMCATCSNLPPGYLGITLSTSSPYYFFMAWRQWGWRKAAACLFVSKAYRHLSGHFVISLKFKFTCGLHFYI